MPTPFLTAEWRSLAMLNYEIDPAVLLPFVPAGTELDQWQGKTYVSMVGFMFLKTRVLGITIPFHTDFEEVNLRFYVRRLGPDGWRRGVVFIKELVPSPAIAWTARVFYNENYVALPMSHRITNRRRGPACDVRLGFSGSRQFPRGLHHRRPGRNANRLLRGIHHRALLGLCPPARRRHGRVSSGAPALARLGRTRGQIRVRCRQPLRRSVRAILTAHARLGLSRRRLASYGFQRHETCVIVGRYGYRSKSRLRR